MRGRLTAPVEGGNGAALREIAALFLRLGATTFGGPAAHLSVMETEVVTRRGWMSRAEFLDHYAVVQVLPGPTSTELAVQLGRVRGGWRGGVLAGLCFVSPAVVLVLLLSMGVGAAAMRPALEMVTRCLAPVVLAVLAQAAWRFGREAAGRAGALVVMPVVAALTVVTALPDLALLACGATAAALVSRVSSRRQVAVLLCGLLLAGAVPALAQHAGTGATAAAPGALGVFRYFLRVGATVYGSGYVLFAFLQQDLVHARGWLGADALTQAWALAQVTPGPLFTTATAAGYMLGGAPGAIAATVGIFAPAFSSVVVGEPVRRLVQRSALLRAALDGVVMAGVVLLGRAVVTFAWPLLDWQRGAALVALLLLARRWVPAALLLLLAVVAGVVISFLP